MSTPRTLRQAAARLLPFIAVGAALAALAALDSDDPERSRVIDLGGGIAIGADGSVVGATPPFTESSIDSVDFLFATEAQWKSLALEMQIGPREVAHAPRP